MSRDTTRNASLGGAVAAAIAASACCVGPLLFALLGLGGAGALVALEPYRPLFTAVTVLLLGIGWYLTYRRPVAHPTSAAQTSPVPHNAVDEDCGWASTSTIDVEIEGIALGKDALVG